MNDKCEHNFKWNIFQERYYDSGEEIGSVPFTYYIYIKIAICSKCDKTIIEKIKEKIND